MPKRYDVGTRWRPRAPDLPDEVTVHEGVTILRLDGGSSFRVRFAHGAGFDIEQVISLAEEFAEGSGGKNAMDDALCAFYVAEDFVDWARDQVDTGHPIEIELACQL